MELDSRLKKIKSIFIQREQNRSHLFFSLALANIGRRAAFDIDEEFASLANEVNGSPRLGLEQSLPAPVAAGNTLRQGQSPDGRR